MVAGRFGETLVDFGSQRLRARVGRRTDSGPPTPLARKFEVALEKAGIEFIDENGGGRGVRLRKRQRFKTPK